MPIHVSLAHALIDLNRDFQAAPTRPDGPSRSLVLWADLLRVVPDEGITVRLLAPAARVSRKALTMWLGNLERAGCLRVETVAPRVKQVTLTELGRAARDDWGAAIVATEAAWCTKVGQARAGKLRKALETVVSQFDLELPHYPITYGSVDPSALGGRAVAAKEGPPRIPPHGTDWVPVPRGTGDTVSDLPLPALLSQALMQFTIDAELRVAILSKAATIASSFAKDSLPFDDVPPLLEVAGNGKSLFERHGVIRVSAKAGARVATLTPLGVALRDAFEPTIAAVHQEWRRRYGESEVDELERALAAVDSRLAAGLPDYVVVRHLGGPSFEDVSLAYA